MAIFSPNHAAKLDEAWVAAGLDRSVIGAKIDQATSRLAHLTAEFRWYETESSARRATLVEAVGVGQMSLSDAAVAIGLLGTPEGRSQATGLMRDAISAILGGLHAGLINFGDDLVIEHLQPAAVEIVTLVEELAPLIEGIESDEEAVAADPGPRAAWGQLSDGIKRWDALGAAHMALRQGSCLPELPKEIDGAYLANRHPDLTPVGIGRLHPVQRLAARVTAGTQPGIYTTAQAIEHATDHERQRNQQLIVDA
jgi:hypothetical protein